jgi:hypothetical protein
LEDNLSWGYTRALGYEDFYPPTYEVLDEEEVFELALWQTFWEPPNIASCYTGVQDPIPELRNEHTQPTNPFLQSPWNGSMAAIGVRCTSSSVTGTAAVNGLEGTFTDFEREDPSVINGNPNIPRFSFGVPFMFQHERF